jgi:hypothetical protein
MKESKAMSVVSDFLYWHVLAVYNQCEQGKTLLKVGLELNSSESAASASMVLVGTKFARPSSRMETRRRR